MDQVLARCLGGDQEAWGVFVDRYAPVIYAAVGRVFKGRRGVPLEDVVQDVFVRLVRDDFRILRQFDPVRASLPTYLAIVAGSTARDQLRRKRLVTQPLDGHGEPAADVREPVQPIELPAGLLSPRQQLVLSMLFDRQMSVEDVAQVLGVTHQTVRSSKHKAIQKLREYYRESDRP